MPVTFHVASHPAEPFPSSKNFPSDHSNGSCNGEALYSTPLDLLKRCAPGPASRVIELLQSSVSGDISSIIPQKNGLVHTCIEAYNKHRNLILRPDDVWMAIISQFSFYVNKHSEEMRKYFVEHKGKKELAICAEGNRYTVDFGAMAKQMGHLIQENVIDEELREWIIPNFTTSTLNDVICSSAMMMATLKNYFDYNFMLLCGIPSVTLLGEKSDWENLLGRLSKITNFGSEHPELLKWHSLLRPILQNFVKSFAEPRAFETRMFWSQIAHRFSGGSGPSYLSGWITAFCVFSPKGNWQSGNVQRDLRPRYRGPTRDGNEREPPKEALHDWTEMHLKLMDENGNEVEYPIIDSNDIPASWCEVDVKINDNGEEFMSIMVSGLVGSAASSFKGTTTKNSGLEGNDTVQPYAAWWIFQRDSEDNEE